MNFLSFSGQLLIERSDSNKDHRDLKQSGSSSKSKQIEQKILPLIYQVSCLFTFDEDINIASWRNSKTFNHPI